MSRPDRPRVREAPYGHTLTLVPDAQDAFAAVTRALWDPAGAAPERAKELVFLRTSIVNLCDT